MIIINLKNYKSGSEILKLVSKIPKEFFVAVPPINLSELKKAKCKVIAQHVDYKNSERETGYTTPNSLKENGINFSLLNHSEHKIPLKEIKLTINECKKSEVRVICCASSIEEVKEISKFEPYAIAYENPDLIATGKSITKMEPEKIKKFVNELKRTKIIPLCGSGINSKKDIVHAMELGCKGVLISSMIARSKKPLKVLKEITTLE